jgi:general secretion pathway protein I
VSRTGGFTLIEVLVALTIVAVALGAGLRAVGAMSERTREGELRIAALWSADNRLQEQFLANPFPPVGTAEVDCPQGQWPLRCVTEVSATPNEFIRKVVVRVWTLRDGARDRQVARLVAFGSSVPRQ